VTRSDAVVGCISSLSLEQMGPWLNSLERCGFQGRRIIIHVGSDPQLVAELNRRGYETYDAAVLHTAGGRLKRNPTPDEISVDRFYYIWYFLSRERATAMRYLIATDVRDVLFQLNPSEYLERRLEGKRILVSSESVNFEDEPWGAQAMQDAFGPQVWEAHRRNTIYNAGTIAGDFPTMVELSLQVYLTSPGDRVQYCDQQALNLLLASGVYRDITRFVTSEDAWACQAGTTAEPKLLEVLRDRLQAPLPHFDGEFVRTAGGEIYTLVHQYDRVPAWDYLLKARYQ
jgi:hypothetical protein